MSDRMTEIVAGIGVTNTSPVTPYEAVIDNTVTAYGQNLFVIIPSIDGGRTTKGPLRWTPIPGPSGQLIYPHKGDLAQVVRTNEGYYWLTQFIPATFPSDTNIAARVAALEKASDGFGRWYASNSTAAANAYYAWGTQDAATDTAYYARDTISGKAASTMLKVLVAGWYRFEASVLTGPQTGIRHDAYLMKFNTDKVTNAGKDQSLGDAVSSGYVKHNLQIEMLLAVNEGVGVLNAAGPVYNDSTPWSTLQARYLGIN